jgi:hypothetical protein
MEKIAMTSVEVLSVSQSFAGGSGGAVKDCGNESVL